MAGQGLNLGLGDVSELVSQITSALSTGHPPYDDYHLQQYEKARMRKNLSMQAGVHALHEVFKLEGKTARIVRAVGMAGVNIIPGVKGMLKDAAMGR